MYQGNSIVDYLRTAGQAYDFASRAKLAASKGIQGYSGTAQQNTQLLNMLRGGGVPQSTQTPQQSQPSPQPQTQQRTQTSTLQAPATSGGSTPDGVPFSMLPPELLYGGNLDVSNPAKQAQYQQILQQFRQSSPGTSGGLSGASTFLNTPTINLPELYQNLYDKSGISQVEKELSEKSRAYTEAVAKIKDNPYLSEATMSGRLRKIDDKFNADTQNIRNDIATRKADIETKLNLEMKQFDIKSQQATQALNQFNSLLASGALDSASGEDIANITRGTGMSSSMIQAAINANKSKNVQTSAIQFDDGTNQGFIVINSKTGEVISKQNIAASKPREASITQQKDADTEQSRQNLIVDIKAGVTPRNLVPHYSAGLTIDEIYRLYNIYSPYGAAKELNGIDDWKAGKFIS